MSDHHIDDLLRDLDPARDHDIPAPDSVRWHRIRSRALRRRSRNHRVLVGAAAALLVTGATAGAMVLWSGEPEVASVTCYADADLDSDRAAGDLRLGLGTDACTHLWQTGPFGDGRPPPLVACLLDQRVGVFPGPEETCERLGLPVAVGGDSVLATMADLEEALRSAMPLDACIEPEVGLASATQALIDLGLDDTDWIARQTQPTTPERPCASFSIDQEQRLVAIIPVP